MKKEALTQEQILKLTTYQILSKREKNQKIEDGKVNPSTHETLVFTDKWLASNLWFRKLNHK